jgi:hypothetical protein
MRSLAAALVLALAVAAAAAPIRAKIPRRECLDRCRDEIALCVAYRVARPAKCKRTLVMGCRKRGLSVCQVAGGDVRATARPIAAR